MKFQYLLCGFLILFLGAVVAFLVFDMGQAQSGPILQAQMISPRYRNAIYPTMDDPEIIKIRIRIGLSQNELDQTSMDVALCRNVDVIKTWQISDISEDDVIELPVSDVTFEYTRSGPYVIDDNPYQFTLELKKQGNLLDTATLELNKYPPPTAGVNEVRVDDHGNIVINGVPAFIYGSYLMQYRQDWYDALQNLGFTTFMEGTSTISMHPESCWGFIRVWPDHQQRITSVREFPNVLAYNLVDEPNSHDYTGDEVREYYEIAKEEDPYHPAGWTGKINNITGYYSIADYSNSMDIFILDMYPITFGNGRYTDIALINDNYGLLRSSTLGYSSFDHENIPVISVPQMFESEYHDRRMPQNHEQKNMVFQHIINGAKGFIPYSYLYNEDYLDRWSYYGDTLIPEIKKIEDAIFAPDTSTITIESSNQERLIYRTTQTGS